MLLVSWEIVFFCSDVVVVLSMLCLWVFVISRNSWLMCLSVLSEKFMWVCGVVFGCMVMKCLGVVIVWFYLGVLVKIDVVWLFLFMLSMVMVGMW